MSTALVTSQITNRLQTKTLEDKGAASKPGGGKKKKKKKKRQRNQRNNELKENQ
jgi:hypothetical protein